MYCSNCGTDNQQDASFCCKCGAELKGESNVINRNNNEIKLDRNYINKIGRIASELKQLDDVDKSIQQVKTDLDSVNKSLAKNNSNNGKGRLILIISGFTLKIVQSISLIKNIIIGVITGSVLEQMFNGEDFNVVDYLIFFTSIIVALAVDKKIYPLIKEMVEKSIKTEHENLMERQAKDIMKSEQLDNTKNQLINFLSENLGIIPPNYRYALAVQYIYESMLNMRARNLTEAINLYEEQLHRWRIEDAQQRMVELARQQTVAAQVSAAANVASAVHTGDIARQIRNATK